MSNVIHQPHDKLFKQAMADIRVARQFFEVHLPALILDRVDLKTLKIEKHSFIDKAYKGSEADVVYSVRIAEGTGYFYLLCENQSDIDEHMAFRLLTYTVRLMENHLKQYRKQSLPIVYPLVLYTGKKPWNATLDIMDLFGDHKELAKQFLFKPYNLIEVQKEKDEDLRRHLWNGIMEFVLKHRRTKNFLEFLNIFNPWLDDIVVEEGIDFAIVMLRYAYEGIEKGNEKLLIEKANEFVSSKLRGEVMTIAEQIERRGMQKGIKQGRITVLLDLLQEKFGSISTRYLNLIQQAELITLSKWTRKILEAQTLNEIFEK